MRTYWFIVRGPRLDKTLPITFHAEILSLLIILLLVELLFFVWFMLNYNFNFMVKPAIVQRLSDIKVGPSRLVQAYRQPMLKKDNEIFKIM